MFPSRFYWAPFSEFSIQIRLSCFPRKWVWVGKKDLQYHLMFCGNGRPALLLSQTHNCYFCLYHCYCCYYHCNCFPTNDRHSDLRVSPAPQSRPRTAKKEITLVLSQAWTHSGFAEMLVQLKKRLCFTVWMTSVASGKVGALPLQVCRCHCGCLAPAGGKGGRTALIIFFLDAIIRLKYFSSSKDISIKMRSEKSSSSFNRRIAPLVMLAQLSLEMP